MHPRVAIQSPYRDVARPRRRWGTYCRIKVQILSSAFGPSAAFEQEIVPLPCPRLPAATGCCLVLSADSRYLKATTYFGHLQRHMDLDRWCRSSDHRREVLDRLFYA